MFLSLFSSPTPAPEVVSGPDHDVDDPGELAVWQQWRKPDTRSAWSVQNCRELADSHLFVC